MFLVVLSCAIVRPRNLRCLCAATAAVGTSQRSHPGWEKEQHPAQHRNPKRSKKYSPEKKGTPQSRYRPKKLPPGQEKSSTPPSTALQKGGKKTPHKSRNQTAGTVQKKSPLPAPSPPGQKRAAPRPAPRAKKLPKIRPKKKGTPHSRYRPKIPPSPPPGPGKEQPPAQQRHP